jgi:hypothetical protein
VAGRPGDALESADDADYLVPGARVERLADLARAVGAATYLCGTGGSRYLDLVPFTALGLAVAMFTSPEHAADRSPENARRVSVLADLAAAGPERLSTTMREHARLSRDAGTSAGGRISVLKQPVSVY